MKNKTNIILTGMLLLLFSACEEFIEPDLTKKTVSIIAPSDNSSSSNYTPIFWWNDVKGASNYQLQIVKPNFTNIQQLVLDTTISINKFSYTLSPGTYQWRVRALNGSSATPFVTYSLSIDSTLDLAGQTLILFSPTNNYYSNSFTQTFTWTVLSNASNYIFQVFTAAGAAVDVPQSITSNTATHTFLADGTYKWRVFAQNSTSNSPYSERTIIIDTSNPLAPTLTHPIANDTSSNPVSLNWTSDTGVVLDSFFVYSDSALSVLLTSDTTSVHTATYSGSVGQDYFWRVRSKDAAGNWSTYAAKRKFIIVP